MNEPGGVPFHPALVHFPIATAALAALVLSVAAARGRERAGALVDGAAALLGVTLATLPFVVWSGLAWAGSLGYLPDGGWLPPETVLAGVLRQHVLTGASATGALLLAFFLTLRARNGKAAILPALLGALAGAGLVLYGAHLGGRMIYTILKS